MFTGLMVAIAVALVAYAASSLRRGSSRLVNQTCRRVFVFNSKTRPATILRGHYEWLTIEESRKLLLCGPCAEKVSGASAYQAQSVAYVCANCGRLVWRDEGKDVPFEEQKEKLSEEDRATIARITAELSQPYEMPTLSRL